ncbi:MAG: response regulator transcription factor [Lachnospiraceae bacterium]|nr:response regulator transcription factor [Lachnospiraceae bacterium]
MHYNCLIVDDEKELAEMTCEYFNLFDVSCLWTDTAQGCKQMMDVNTFDILLLDINLNEESGFKLCKAIRDTSDIPILFISARQSDEDILTALNIGGDDYIKKPYTLSVLLAKVKAVLKRMSLQKHYVTNGDENIWLDEATMKVGVRERVVQLKAKEFKLFACLFEHRGTIVTKDKLFDTVWGDTFYSDGTLNVHIRRLREKLEENPDNPDLIKTVWGTGYILEA